MASKETVQVPAPVKGGEKKEKAPKAAKGEPVRVVEMAPPPVFPKPPENVGDMRRLRISKVTVNIGVGQSGDRLEKAEKVLQTLTHRKAVRTVSRDAHREWQVRQGQPIGVKVTLRGGAAVDFAKRALWSRNFRVADWSFDRAGNLNFGVPDHTGFEGQKYNPDIGVFGLDVAITVERVGFRIKHRRLQARSVPPAHRVTRDESMAFLKQVLGVEILER